MTAAGGLEGAYRRLLRRYYPPFYLRGREEEILGVLMAAAQPGQRRPGARESADLLRSALIIRIRMILRGADSQPWADALALTGVLLPLLMLVLKLTLYLVRGAQYGFGTPADILIGAYGEPGTYSGIFQLNPYSVAVTSQVTSALTAGPVPALILAGLVCCGLRRTAAIFAASIPLAYLAISLASGYMMLAAPRVDVTLYAYALEALILLAAPAAPRGWRALRWRPAALLAAATVAAGIGMNGGLRPLFRKPPTPAALARLLRQFQPGSLPRGFIGYIDRLFGVGLSGWGDWIVFQGTLVAVVAVALTIMLVSSPVNRRVLFLLAVPFALGAVIYLFSLINPPLPGPAGNALTIGPLLLILLTAVALRLIPRSPAGPAAPQNT